MGMKLRCYVRENGGENEKMRFYAKKCLHFIFWCDNI